MNQSVCGISSSTEADAPNYRQVCYMAAHDDLAFSMFRKNPVYRSILEHFSRDEGAAYLNEIQRSYPWLLPQMDKYAENDRFGGADITNYPGVPPISPSTLRYVKQLGELATLFGPLDGKHIVEIGGGYGGLCRLIMTQYPSASYTLMDLPEVLELVDRYLSGFGTEIRQRVQLMELSGSKTVIESDLVISNCAFSEYVSSVQDEYLSCVISHASAGYLLCNRKPDAYPRAVIIEKMLAFGYREMGTVEERPMTAVGNITLVWGNKHTSKLGRLPYSFERVMYRLFPDRFLRFVALYRKIRRVCRPARRALANLRFRKSFIV